MNDLNATRNIGISAHIDSGKTTLTERILYYTGVIHKMEEVRGGGSGATMDFMDLEKEKGITITSAATSVYWDKYKINIIDTPGHVDFTVEVERALRVLDGAVMILCAVAGVQSQSITVDRQMKRYRVPRLVFINKMDRTGADPFKAISDLKEKLGHNAIAMQIPIGKEDGFEGVIDLIKMKALYNEGKKGESIFEKEIPEELLETANEKRAEMLECVSMYNDQLMEDLLEEKEISEELVYKAVLDGVNSMELTPVYMGSAFKNKAIQPLLDAICRYLPSPISATPMSARDVNDESRTMQLEPDKDKPLVCMAFKITDEQFGQLTHIRIYQGTIRKGMNIYNSRTGKKIRVGRLVRMHSDKRENIEEASAGDIIAMIGVDCASGDTFCSDEARVTLESMYVAQPVISLAVTTKDTSSIDRMSKALSRFMKEDPTFRVESDPESGETIISGMGELHLDIIVDRLRREFKVEVNQGQPQVEYKEALTAKADHREVYKKQTGGRGKFADIVFTMEPAEEGKAGLEFVNEIKGGNIPKEYIPSVEKGFKQAMQNGPLAGFEMDSMKITLKDGSFHPVDSDSLSFELAAKLGYKEAARAAKAVLMEPIMKLEVLTPEENMGDIVGDLNRRRGQVNNMDDRAGSKVIKAEVPLSEMFGYVTALRTLSSGRATSTMEFSHYAETPGNLAEEVIKTAKGVTV